MSHIGGMLFGSFSEKTSANSFNIKTIAEVICSWESLITSRATRMTIVDPLAISLSRDFRLIKFNAYGVKRVVCDARNQ